RRTGRMTGCLLQCADVCSGSFADSCRAAKGALFDHLVGAAEKHRSPTHAPVTRQVSLLGVFYRCDMMIMRVTRGAISLSTPTHFPTSESSQLVNPHRTGVLAHHGKIRTSVRVSLHARISRPPAQDSTASGGGRSYARRPGFRELSKAPRACE